MLWLWQKLIILIFLIAEYVFKKFDVSVGERQSLKETLAKSIGQKYSVATLENWLKEVSKWENFVFGGGLSEMLWEGGGRGGMIG